MGLNSPFLLVGQAHQLSLLKSSRLELTFIQLSRMTQIVSNIIQNSLSGFVAGAVTTVGGYAGDAIAGLGNFVERKGDDIGDSTVIPFLIPFL